MLYIIYPDVDIWNYMLQDYKEDSKDVIIRPLNRYCSKWQLPIRKLLNNSKLPSWMILGNQMRHELRSLKNGDSILICDYADPVLSMAVSSIVDIEVKKNYWIWNPASDNISFYSHGFDVMRKYGYKLATFDPNDAKDYGMDNYHQFFRMTKKSDRVEENHDFYFVGFAKNREQELLRLKEKLKDFRTLFKIAHSGSETISYEESIKNIQQSKCIVEYIQHNQSGMTLRPLEAICYEKKLITNNLYVVNYNFYRPENVFVLGKDKIENISNFINTPYITLPESLIAEYSVETWLNNFK